MIAAEYFNSVYPDYELRQPLDKQDILELMDDYFFCKTTAAKGMDQIREESILSRPEQGGEEEMADALLFELEKD